MIKNNQSTASYETLDVRAAFVSDVHLGSPFCNAAPFLEFLQGLRCERLYLVGDIIDGWRLRKAWHWPAVYHQIVHQLFSFHEAGTQLLYAPGNHDEFLRNYLLDFGFIDIADEFVHEAADAQRFLVTHGDKFDEVERSAPWLSSIGSSAYETLMWSNHAVNQLRRFFQLSDCRFSSRVKFRVKRAVQFISDFERRIAEHARHRNCGGVICGHIHAPALQQYDDVMYCNTGDWVEHCTALVEHWDGSWEVLGLETSLRFEREPSNGENILQHVGRGSRARSASGGARGQFAATT